MPNLVMFMFENVVLALIGSMHYSEEQNEGINMEVNFSVAQIFGPIKLEGTSNIASASGPTKLEGTSSVTSNFGDMVPSSAMTLLNVAKMAIFFGDINATIVFNIAIIVGSMKSFLL
jgi:hypothetical protein